MNNELIKKAYEKFNGVWPRGYSHLIERGSGEIIPATVMEDGSFDYTYQTRKVNTFVKGKKCTKANFEEYGDSLINIPEGATHHLPTPHSYDYWKEVKGGFVYHDGQEWGDQVCSLAKVIDNLTPIQATKWLPEVGQEWKPRLGMQCEMIVGNITKNVTFVGLNSNFSFVVQMDEDGEYKSYHPHQVKFRPLKTEREKFIERSREGELAIANEVAYEKILGTAYDKGARFND